MKSVSEAFKVLGDPTRLEIVKMLVGKELCVCDILDAFPVSQPTISHHLKVLKYAGIVEDSRDGRWIYYRLNAAVLAEMMRVVGELNKDAGKAIRARTCDA
jgi:ArsR family transcriptional regulator